MSNLLLYIITIILLIISFNTDKKKTKKALNKAWKSFENILPEILGVIMIVGVLLAVLNSQVISNIIGENSGYFGIIIASFVGAITLIPGFVAFPTAAMLLDNGASIMPIAVFVSTLMMVGIVTLPVEIKYFNKKLAISRNIIAFIFSFFVAFIIGKVSGGI